MKKQKLFTLQEARQLLPSLRNSLEDANKELEENLQFIRAAHEFYEKFEKKLDEQGRQTDLQALRDARAGFQEAIENLSETQQTYLDRLNFWVEKITSCGVILRDLREGLLDFPAQEGRFKFLLCWKLGEQDIDFWHDENSGIAGRKPIATLSEYY